MFFVKVRHAFLMQPSHASKLSSRTVLFMSVPHDYLNEAKVRHLLGPQVVRVWFPTHTEGLRALVEKVQQNAMKLEGAETKLIRDANRARLMASKKKGNIESEMRHWFTDMSPTHRLGIFGLFGQKVNSIDWYRVELRKGIPEVRAEQEKHRTGEAKKLGIVFVEFNTPTEAQAACQTLTHHRVLTMAPRFTGVRPSDVIWPNLAIRSWERNVRSTLSTAFVVVLIVFWSFPVAVISVISNIHYIIGPAGKLPQLDWILRMPRFLLGIVTGLLPTIMLTALMSLLPVVLRLAALLSGSPTYSDIEHTVQNYYFGFQVVQVFLATTLTSAVSRTIAMIIDDPSSAITLISTSIPRASSFYLSYFVLQGLGVATRILVDVTGLLGTPLVAKVLGSTPRKIFQTWNQLYDVGWGTLYPVYTNLFVIGRRRLRGFSYPRMRTNYTTAICYSCIAPLVTGFAAIGLFLFYFAYRYNFLYVYETSIDMKGLSYARALQHLFVGLYISELCLIGLFGTRLSRVGAIGPFALMILLLFTTALYHISLNTALTPLVNFLPKTIEIEDDQPLSSLPYKKPNMFVKLIKGYADMNNTPRPLVPWVASRESPTDDRLIQDAYLPPEVWADVPLLLVPRDETGISPQECRNNEKIGIHCTDAAAYLNKENDIVIEDGVMAAIYTSTKEQLIKAC